MIRLTVEETNLLSIYNEGGKRALIENVNAALPYMDADMRELAKRTLSKVDALTEAEFAELADGAGPSPTSGISACSIFRAFPGISGGACSSVVGGCLFSSAMTRITSSTRI